MTNVTMVMQRNRLGMAIILLHVVYILLYLAFGVIGMIPLKYIAILLGIIVPPMAGAAKTIVDHTIKNPIEVGNVSHPRVSFLFMVLPYIFVFSHAAIVIAVLIAFSTGKFSIEQIGTVLGIGETAFAVYLGMFVKSLFNVDGQQSDTPNDLADVGDR